jgi:hypothetical protein
MIKFSYKIAHEMRSLKELGVPITKISKKYGVSRQAIYEWLDKIKSSPLTTL